MKAKEFGGCRVGFGVIEEEEMSQENMVFDSEFIYHQRKDDVTRDVTEETAG